MIVPDIGFYYGIPLTHTRKEEECDDEEGSGLNFYFYVFGLC